MTGKKKKRLILALVIAVLFLAGIVIISLTNEQKIDECDFSNNAAWISVDWVNEPVSAENVTSLMSAAQARDIRTLYVYTSYLQEDGTFSPTYSQTPEFTEQLHLISDEVVLLSWIGLPLENDTEIGIQGWVDLDDPEVRQQIIQFAVFLVEDYGMDGIHINAETVKNGDDNFLLLLEELREALGEGVVLSIAGSHLWPDWLTKMPYIEDFRWTGAYYREVTERTDQIAVMTYDSHLPFSWLYRIWTSWQVRHINQALNDVDTELLFGVSVSREFTTAHQPAEQLETGLGGICIENPNSRVAIYADWEFSSEDWLVWNQFNNVK